MRVDPTTLLFEDIDDAMAVEMFGITEALVLKGTVPNPHPAWLAEWFRVAGFTGDRELLTLATVLPSRVFLSLLRRRDLP